MNVHAGRTDAWLKKKAEVNTMSFPNPDGQKKLDEMSTKLKEHLSDERIDMLRRYFEAANNFYQIITLKRLFRIINSQNSETYTEGDFLAYAEITRHERHYFEIYGLDEIFERQPESTPINRLPFRLTRWNL